MTNILIMSQPDDTHAAYVKLALERRGHYVVILYSGDFPTLQTHSFHLLNDNMSWSSNGIDGFPEQIKFDVVWYRRYSKPILPDSLHPDDVENAQREVNAFFQATIHSIATDAVWINSLISRVTAKHKLIQLKTAADVGWKYPETLVSNDPEEIKRFLKTGADKGVIYKTFSPVAWFDKSTAWLTYTQKIVDANLPSDEILQLVPGIFQHYIDKQFEIRVTYLNGYCVAVKIDSQLHDKAKHDWRHAPAYELNVERIYLPGYVVEKCKLLMKRLNLIFGCIDIIYTDDNEYVFLEVNEQGQFLWIEDVNPDIKMLDMFTQFLIAKGNMDLFVEDGLSMSDLDELAVKHMKKAVLLHKGTALMR